VALHERNSDAESGRELFKPSKDLQCLSNPQNVLYFAKKKIFLVGGCEFFVSDVISGGLLGHLGLIHLALAQSVR